MRCFLAARRCAVLGILFVLMLVANRAQADLLATFEDLVPDTPYAGPGGGMYWNGSDESGGFTTGGFDFVNNFNTSFGSWDAWAYSNTTDTVTPGFGNQYSAYAGEGAGGSSQYGVFFQPFSNAQTVSLAAGPAMLAGGYFTNTTYAGLSMLNGDAFAKQFGGASGDDPDWFLLTVTGLAEGGAETGSVELYLADYRFEDNSQDYILDEWTWLDMSTLGEVAGLQFTLSSSDVGAFGMNTPAYFALDNLSGLSAVPEPASCLLWGVGAFVACASARRRRRKAAACSASC